MLTEKYKEEFLELYDKTNNKGQTVKNIIETEQETGIELLKWDEPQIIIFLKKSGSVAPTSLNMNMGTVRRLAGHICKREKLPTRSYDMEDGSFIQLIDKKQLMSVTLSYAQYINIKNQLDITEGGERINVRDKLIFELAWEGLTPDEMRFIKEENIKFSKSDNGWDIAIITLENKTIRIENPEVVEDIKLCLKETYIIRTTKSGVKKKVPYKDSEYMLKPTIAGKTSEKTYLDQPNIALQGVFRGNEITCEGVDVTGLSLADIRRSKLIYLLAPENESFFDLKTVAGIFNIKSEGGLSWLKTISKEIYPIKE